MVEVLDGRDWTAQGESADDLRDTLESAWDAGEAAAAEWQISADTLAAEIERRDPSDRELTAAAWDAGEARARAREEGADAPDPADRPGEIRKSLADEYDKAAKADADPDAKPADDAKPETPAADAKPDTPAWSAEDRAALDKMTPDARQWAERKAGELRATYGGVDALAGKWGGYLSGTGADTPEKQIGVLDNLIATKHALDTGTPEQRAAILGELVRRYGTGAPGNAPPAAPAPGPGTAPHPLQAAALASPNAPAQATPAGPNDLRGRLESDWQAQQAAEAARATPEGQAAAQREREAEAVKQLQEFADANDEFGHPKHGLLAAVMPEMTEAARMIRAAGHPVDLGKAYRAAVQYAAETRPDQIMPFVDADHLARVRAFKQAHPVAHDERLDARMTSLAKADLRRGAPLDLNSLRDRALKVEPEIAARQEAHAAAEKRLGFNTPRPSLRQLLESAWDAQAAA